MMEYLTEQEAADFLGVAAHTMYKWRASCTGPRWQSRGKRSLYLIDDLKEFAAKKHLKKRTRRARTDGLIYMDEAAKILGVTITTLAGWRDKGRGPESKKIGGSIVYDPVEINRWMNEQVVTPRAPSAPKQQSLDIDTDRKQLIEELTAAVVAALSARR